MNWFDWIIVIVPLIFVLGMGWYVRRYIQGVADFLSAGRLCGRYLISVANVASALSIIGLVSYVEIHYKTGFALSFWQGLVLPISIIMGLTGFCTYRFRETRAMSMGQFLEMRYSRKFRIFAAALRSVSEMLANMIMPAVAARFFIGFLDLPRVTVIFGMEISTYMIVVALCLTLAISIICMGGMLSIIVTDSLQGLILYPLMVLFTLFILYKFSWSEEIVQVMSDRAAGESFLNPYDVGHLRDFNFLMFGVTVFALILHRASWFASGGTTARTAHEQKMAGILGSWRGALNMVFYVLVAIGVITVLNHKNYSSDAKEIRNALIQRAVDDAVPQGELHNRIVKATSAIPEHNHTIGKDAPLGEKKNLDTPYLETVHSILKDETSGNSIFQEFRTLYYQMMMAFSMRHLLPAGMLGAFCLLLLMAMISTDDSSIYSAASTIAQDCILPFKKHPFTPSQQIWLIRCVSIGVGIFFFIGSFYMAQLDYINLFVTIMTTMWLGGCGPVMIFGLYGRFGTTAGAWTSLITGMCMALTGVVLQRNWANLIYPYLHNNNLVDSVGNFLSTVSSPLNPIVVWEMNPVKCPINSYEIYFITMITTLVLYCVVSLATRKEPFNIERMLHRGSYSLGENKVQPLKWTPRNIFANLLGITPEYSRGDKVIAWGMFFYSFVYAFGLFFVTVLIWNFFDPWSIHWWGHYYFITLLLVPGIIAAITTVWFGIGGVMDMRQLFRDLKSRKINILDDGRVEGNVSLADKEFLCNSKSSEKGEKNENCKS